MKEGEEMGGIGKRNNPKCKDGGEGGGGEGCVNKRVLEGREEV
jgi:hypothetical protein